MWSKASPPFRHRGSLQGSQLWSFLKKFWSFARSLVLRSRIIETYGFLFDAVVQDVVLRPILRSWDLILLRSHNKDLEILSLKILVLRSQVIKILRRAERKNPSHHIKIEMKNCWLLKAKDNPALNLYVNQWRSSHFKYLSDQICNNVS